MYATPTMNTTTTSKSDRERGNRRQRAFGAVEFFGDGDVPGIEFAAGLGEIRVLSMGHLLGGVALLAYAQSVRESPSLSASDVSWRGGILFREEY